MGLWRGILIGGEKTPPPPSMQFSPSGVATRAPRPRAAAVFTSLRPSSTSSRPAGPRRCVAAAWLHMHRSVGPAHLQKLCALRPSAGPLAPHTRGQAWRRAARPIELLRSGYTPKT